MAAEFRWYGPEFQVKFKAMIGPNLERAAIYLKGEIKESLRIGNKTGKTPSSPGEPPRRRTGRLSGSIAHEVDWPKLIARVGTNLRYAKFLELGTSKMAARPFIRPAVAKARGAIAAILSKDTL